MRVADKKILNENVKKRSDRKFYSAEPFIFSPKDSLKIKSLELMSA